MIQKSSKIYLFIVLISIFAFSCISDPGFSDVPELEYIGISKNSMVQNSLNTDSLLLQFNFTDGDGDFGSDSEDFNQNILITDNRTGQIYDSFKAPTIPPQGASKGIKGEVTLRIFTTCCLFPDNIPPCEAPPQFPMDTLTLDIQIMDRSQNMSNIITTENIILLCN